MAQQRCDWMAVNKLKLDRWMDSMNDAKRFFLLWKQTSINGNWLLCSGAVMWWI